MRYKERFVCIQPSAELLGLLEKNKIRYKISGAFKEPAVIFFLYEDKKIDERLRVLAREECVVPIIYKEFSKKELVQAEILTFRPIYPKVAIDLDSDSFVYSCVSINAYGDESYGHMNQIAPSVISREPVWKRRAFYSEDCGYSQVYCNQRIVDLARKNNLHGIQFNSVYLKNGDLCTNTFQLTAKTTLRQETLALGHGEQKSACCVCGKTKFVLNHRYQLHLYRKEIDLASDFYQTDPLFGEGIPEPFFLISQKFYQVLLKENLTSGLLIEPVCLV